MFLLCVFLCHAIERQNRVASVFIVKATGESSDSSTSLTVFKSVQNVVSSRALTLYLSYFTHT